jgi:hypothetical protein
VSQENIELHYRAMDAFNRRDLGAYLALTDPEVEFTPYEVSVQGGEPYRGHAGVRTWWEESFAVFPDLRAELYEVRELGDRTFARGRLRGQGAGSGASTSGRCGRPPNGATRRRSGGAPSRARPRPSKPSDSRSRRCRGRTWRRSAR